MATRPKAPPGKAAQNTSAKIAAAKKAPASRARVSAAADTKSAKEVSNLVNKKSPTQPDLAAAAVCQAAQLDREQQLKAGSKAPCSSDVVVTEKEVAVVDGSNQKDTGAGGDGNHRPLPMPSRRDLAPSPFTESDFHKLAGVPPTVRGDQPSEILPGLFLGGHPARFVGKGGFPSYPVGALHAKTSAKVVVNCCAAATAAPHIVECVTDGAKTFSTSVSESFEQATGNNHVVLHNVAMVDDEAYPIGDDMSSVVSTLATALVPQWRSALGKDSLCTEGIRGAFVHCQMGVSRSGTIVVAFIMWAFGLDLAVALGFVESRRPCVSPNPGFMTMLQSF